jgi:CubicO group peptidase (beta-lactamase class C family)
VKAQGDCSAGFERLRDRFVRGFESGDERGGAVCVYVGSERVVDLWAGWADAEGRRLWQRDTLAMPYSVSKAMVATCALLLCERGQLDLDEPVARYWPEFAQAGKGAIPVRWILSHQAGVVALDEPLTTEDVADWTRVTTALARTRPRWTPGTAHGECARFYGHLVGELVRRTDGRSLGRFFCEEIAEPCDIDFHFGLGPDELARCAEMIPFSAEAERAMDREETSIGAEARANPPGMRDVRVINSEWFRKAEIPAVNGHGTARGVARFHALLAAGGSLDGVRVLSEPSVDKLLEVQSDGPELVLGGSREWTLGLIRFPGDAFAMGGLGGHLGLLHRKHRVEFGYVKNRLSIEDRATPLLVELARSLSTSSGP